MTPNGDSLLFNENVPKRSKELIEKLLPPKIVEYHVLDDLPKTCPFAEQIEQQRKALGGQLLFDRLASLVGQSSLTQNRFPYQSKEDLKKIYLALWPSSFSDLQSTILGHLMTIYLLLSSPDDLTNAEEYSKNHGIPNSLFSLIRAYKYFDIGAYKEFTSNLASYVSYQRTLLKESSRLDSEGASLVLKQLLRQKEYKAALFFYESFKFDVEDPDILKMLFHHDFRSCLRYARANHERLNALVELCVVPEYESLARKLLETPFSPSEVGKICSYAYDHLENTRLGNFAFLLLYAHHFYALAIHFQSFLGTSMLPLERKRLVEAMQAKLTGEERAQLKQFQMESSFMAALKQLLSGEKAEADIAEIPATLPKPTTFSTMKSALVFRPKPQVNLPPSKYLKVSPEKPLNKLKKLKSRQKHIRHRRKKEASSETASSMKEHSLNTEKNMEREVEQSGDATPIAQRRYPLRSRASKETDVDQSDG